MIGARGHHHVVGLEPAVAARHHEPVPGSGEPVHCDVREHGQLESGRVSHQIVGHLILRREGRGRRGERHARQPIEAGRGEHAERVPAPPPGAADPLVRIKDQKGPTLPHQVVAHGQTGLAATDDDGLDSIGGFGHSPWASGVAIHRKVRAAETSPHRANYPKRRRIAEWVVSPSEVREAGARTRRRWPQRATTHLAW